MKLPRKNPTTWAFRASIEEVQYALRNEYANAIAKDIEFAGDSNIVWGRKILREVDNKNDAYLYNYDGGNSLMYRDSIRGIPYSYCLHFHITNASENLTEVSVRTIDPCIYIGQHFPFNVLTFLEPKAPIIKKVPPSTIEEYRVLLAIGKRLGQKDQMPPLVLPDSSMSVKVEK